jgi:hypothetical protein
MASFKFIYGVECWVEAKSESEALAKMVSLQTEEDCPCGKADCDCVFEGTIGIWQESVLESKASF